MADSDLILFNTYNSSGTNENLREGTSLIKYGCSHPNQGMHAELCGGYTTGRTSKYHNMDWEIYGSTHIILCDSTDGKMYDLVYGSETVNLEMELNRMHRYSIIIDSYGGTTTVTCPVCGYVKSFKGSYSVYVQSYGTLAAGIRTQPQSKTGYVDGTFQLSVDGFNISNYQWQMKVNDSWTNLSDGQYGDTSVTFNGCTSKKLTISGSRYWLNNNDLRCLVTGQDGQDDPSSEVSLTLSDNKGPEVSVRKSTDQPTPLPVTVTIVAEDPDTGLNNTPYSFNGGVSYQAGNTKTVDENQVLNISVRDASGNTTTEQIVINNITREAPEPEKIYLKGYVGKNGVAVRFL